MISENFSEIQVSFTNLFQNENILSNDNIIALITVSGTLFAFFSIVILNIGDFSRYIKDKSENLKGNFYLILKGRHCTQKR